MKGRRKMTNDGLSVLHARFHLRALGNAHGNEGCRRFSYPYYPWFAFWKVLSAGSGFPGVESVARHAEIFTNVGDDAAWHVAVVPGEGDEPVGAKGV